MISENNHDITPRWLSIQAACSYASMGLKKMLRHINAGEIKATKKGKWFVDRKSIDAFLSGSELKETLLVEKILASVR